MVEMIKTKLTCYFVYLVILCMTFLINLTRVKTCSNMLDLSVLNFYMVLIGIE